MENIISQTTARNAGRRTPRTIWLLLFSLLLASMAVVIIPVFLIQPFRPQTGRTLEISYILRRWSPLATAIALAGSIVLVIWQWPHARRWWRKTLLVIGLLLTIVPAWFARQNHFEWMFNPIRHSAYVKADDASFVRESDMVLAVKLNNEAVAYPVRLMAYHHMVQDVVGGTPICATY